MEPGTADNEMTSSEKAHGTIAISLNVLYRHSPRILLMPV